MALMVEHLFAAILVLAAMSVGHSQYFPPGCPTGFANFGDSLTDTGNALDAFPFYWFAENLPYGEDFFSKPAKRFSNGRLVPDFFSQAFRVPLLDAYFSTVSFNYVNGINLANAGATAAFSPTALSPFSVTPFQTSQFLRFQNSAVATQAQLGCGFFTPSLPGFLQLNPRAVYSTWLYTITAGSNDLSPPFGNASNVPQAVAAIGTAIQSLYGNSGARQFLIFGLPVAGCNPVILSYSGTSESAYDDLGCLVEGNQVAQAFNSLLQQEIATLRSNLSGATIAYFDYYAANLEILTNPATYGFNPNLTKIACCGAPGFGSYNFNPNAMCGTTGSTACANPDKYVIWDGIHYTENFYHQIAKWALSGQYTHGGPNYTTMCNLDFSNFESGVTFAEAYPLSPLQCKNLFY